MEKATLLGSFRIKLIHYLDRVTDIWQRAVEIYQNNKKIMRNRNKICVALQDKSDKLLLTQSYIFAHFFDIFPVNDYLLLQKSTT